MTLSSEITRHHTAWVSSNGSRPRPVRYSVDRDRLVCFGDELPPGTTDGSRVTVTVHEIAGGPAVANLHGVVHDLPADEVDPNALLELLDHVSLGRTAAEIEARIATYRARRIVALAA